ncbi:MAG: AAA family ATPase [Thermodesulfobacteriota bacterium]
MLTNCIKLLKGFPTVTITGPRQSGKTTLARKIFADKPYASLEDPDKKLFAQEDPRSFLEQFPDEGPRYISCPRNSSVTPAVSMQKQVDFSLSNHLSKLQKEKHRQEGKVPEEWYH